MLHRTVTRLRALLRRAVTDRELGTLTAITEDARDAWRWQWVEQIRQDVRYALRAMRKSPVLTAVAVASIALGSGAAIALFAVLDSTLLRRLPVRDPAQLIESHGGSYPLYLRFRELWSHSHARRRPCTGRTPGCRHQRWLPAPPLRQLT